MVPSGNLSVLSSGPLGNTSSPWQWVPHLSPIHSVFATFFEVFKLEGLLGHLA